MKGPTKPGWYWVRFREDDEWVVDRANLKASTGELWWWAYGGRVTDREVVEWQALQPPSKAGTPKPPLTDPAVTANTDSTYVDPPNPAPRSFLAQSKKAAANPYTPRAQEPPKKAPRERGFSFAWSSGPPNYAAARLA